MVCALRSGTLGLTPDKTLLVLCKSDILYIVGNLLVVKESARGRGSPHVFTRLCSNHSRMELHILMPCKQPCLVNNHAMNSKNLNHGKLIKIGTLLLSDFKAPALNLRLMRGRTMYVQITCTHVVVRFPQGTWSGGFALFGPRIA